MRLKEIKPGMVIHCKTKEEMEELSKHIKIFNTVDKIWNYGNDGIRRDCIAFDYKGTYRGFCTYDYYVKEGQKITEFSDLILPELSAEEVFSIMSEIHNESYKKYSGCIGCCLSVVAQNCDTDCFAENADKIIEICAQWKSDHEKKEPKIETVDICRIIEIQPDGRKRCVHEEDLASGSTDAEIKIMIEEELKRYCIEHDGEFIAVHEVVSRVKEVE